MKSLNLISLSIILLLINVVPLIAQHNNTLISIGTQRTYSSKILEEDITLYIHLPSDYSTERSYPVLYLLDGEYFFTQLVSSVDFLSDCAYVQQELVPKFIIVGIATKNRNKDFTPSHAENQYGMPFTESGGAEKFLNFLQEELFADIKKHYSVNDKKLLAGWSLGGLFTTYCYLQHPETFDYYLAVSPSLWWEDMALTRQLEVVIANNKLAKKKFTLTIGSLEKNPMASSVKESFLPIISNVADTNYFDFIEIKGESHSFSPIIAFHKGLQSIFYNWHIPDSLLTEENIFEMEKLIFEYAQDFGYLGKDPHGATYHLYNIALSQANYNEALKVAQFRVQRFPESVYAHYNLGELYYRLNDYDNCLGCIRKAFEIEKSSSEPNNDRIKQFQSDLKEVSEKIKKEKSENANEDEKITDLISRVEYEAWTNGNTEIIDEMYDPNCTIHMGSSMNVKGTQVLKQVIELFHKMIPDRSFKIDKLIVANDRVTEIYRWQGTHKDTGKSLNIAGCIVYHFEDGKVVEVWNFEDMLGFYQQLGFATESPFGQ